MDASSAGPDQPLRLLLVGGPRGDRRALADLITARTAAEVVAEVDFEEAPSAATTFNPDGALIDAQFPDISAVLVARSLRLRLPDCDSIFLTSHADARTLVATVFGQAAGHVVKTLDAPALVGAVGRVLRNDRKAGRAEALIRWCEERARSSAAGAEWPERDLALLRRVASNEADTSIAAALGIDLMTLRLGISELYLALSADTEFLKVGATLARLLR